jgi:hypothetical protein
MRGEGGSLEANSAKSSGQEPDEDTAGTTNDDTPTDGSRMVQEAVRDFAKKRAAAQSKKAGSTRKDAHPGDNRGMMSQDKGRSKGKRSGYTAQQSVSTTARATGSTFEGQRRPVRERRR